MSIIAGLQHAEARMAAYLSDAGSTATISRKINDEWETVESAVPIMVETKSSTQGRIDPSTATEDDAVSRRFMVSKSFDIQLGDRVQIVAPRGSGVRPGAILTVSSIELNSMSPATSGTLTIEEVATEHYTVTIERWSDDIGQYAEILTAPAFVVASNTTQRSDAMGASGSVQRGVLIFEDVPDRTIIPRDSVYGVPWATGAYVSRVHPQVGSRLEVEFAYVVGVN